MIPREAHQCIPPEPLDILYFGPDRLEVVKSLLTCVPHRPELFVSGICSSASGSEAGQPSPGQVVTVRVARAGATDRLRARLEASRTCRELRSRPSSLFLCGLLGSDTQKRCTGDGARQSGPLLSRARRVQQVGGRFRIAADDSEVASGGRPPRTTLCITISAALDADENAQVSSKLYLTYLSS